MGFPDMEKRTRLPPPSNASMRVGVGVAGMNRFMAFESPPGRLNTANKYEIGPNPAGCHILIKFLNQGRRPRESLLRFSLISKLAVENGFPNIWR